MRDPVSPPLCSIINSCDQEPSLWPFSLADIPESLSCNPLHSTRKKRGVSALCKHTRTTDPALLDAFHTLSRAHQLWLFSGDRAGTRKAYRAMPEHQAIFQGSAVGCPSAELLQEGRDTSPAWGHTIVTATLTLVQMQCWCSKAQPCTVLRSDVGTKRDGLASTSTTQNRHCCGNPRLAILIRNTHNSLNDVCVWLPVAVRSLRAWI